MDKEIGYYTGTGPSRYTNAHTNRYSITVSRFAQDMSEMTINFQDHVLRKYTMLTIQEDEAKVLLESLKRFFDDGVKVQP